MVMKKTILAVIISAFFFTMLAMPKQVLAGATEGLQLWSQIVLPTLLPFMIVANLLVSTNIVYYISNLLSPILQPILGISHSGCFAVLSGFLCGFPMGAKIAGDLVTGGHISKAEGKYLISFCNNTSPMFIISYIVIQNLKADYLVFSSLCILLLSAFLGSLIFRRIYHREMLALPPSAAPCGTLRFSFAMLDESIVNSFEAMVRIGGYIILFSILLALAKSLPLTKAWWTAGLLPMIEITNGIPLICSFPLSFPVKYALVLFLAAFGGLCSIAQTKCMVQDADIPIFPYIVQKLVTAGITSLLAYIYIYFTY